MSDWKEFRLQLDFGGNSAKITWIKEGGKLLSGKPMVSITNLPFDQPGDQSETESQQAAREAAKAHLQELIDQL